LSVIADASYFNHHVDLILHLQGQVSQYLEFAPVFYIKAHAECYAG